MPTKQAYERYLRNKEYARQKSREISFIGRDIAPLPPIVSVDRRATASKSLADFCRLYMPAHFPLPFSESHLATIALIEQAVREGGQYAIALPRGSGKTTLALSAVLWATLYGWCRFVVLVAATGELAKQLLMRLRSELEENELLLQDFPEVCYPIRKLENITARAAGQLCDGRPTNIRITRNEIIYPDILGSNTSGIILRTAGLTGALRGLAHRAADGSTVRPDFVLVDDPQTDKTAKSPTQTASREALLDQAIAGLGGVGTKFGCVACVTPIAPGDLAERLLSPDIKPTWRSVRFPMLLKQPKNAALWEQYRELFFVDLQAGTEEARGFYRLNRQAMDEGAEVSWEHRKSPDDISALEHAMRLRFQVGEAAFMAEYQLQPQRPAQAENQLTVEQLRSRLSGIPRGMLPPLTTSLVAAVDINAAILHYVVLAIGRALVVIDYGSYPEQPRQHYESQRPPRPITLQHPGSRAEAIAAGLRALLAKLRDGYKDAGGSILYPTCVVVDANWHDSTEIVYALATEPSYRNWLIPAHGRYSGAGSRPLHPRPGDLAGQGWRYTRYSHRPVPSLLFDANFWKTWLRERCELDPSLGGLVLFGDDAARHQLFCEHLLSEVPQEVVRGGVSTIEWQVLPGRDNHYLDGVVMACAGAAYRGLLNRQVPKAKTAIDFASWQKQAKKRIEPKRIG